MPVHSPPVRSRGSIEDMVHRAIALVAAGMAALTSFAVVVALVTGKGPSRGDLGPAIDLDRGALRIPATGWREKNLARLHRSLLKLRGARSEAEVDRDYAVLRAAYDAHWQRGT